MLTVSPHLVGLERLAHDLDVRVRLHELRVEGRTSAIVGSGELVPDPQLDLFLGAGVAQQRRDGEPRTAPRRQREQTRGAIGASSPTPFLMHDFRSFRCTAGRSDRCPAGIGIITRSVTIRAYATVRDNGWRLLAWASIDGQQTRSGGPRG